VTRGLEQTGHGDPNDASAIVLCPIDHLGVG
jgi:hypothetical protein